MKIFVTGFHRAGTHQAGEYFANKYNIPNLTEDMIRWDSLLAVKILCKGYMPKWYVKDNKKWGVVSSDQKIGDFVLQCPGLAHKTIQLAQLGSVYWGYRTPVNLVTAIRNNLPARMLWYTVKGFRLEFPDDPIWEKLDYDGSEDMYYGFVKYISLLYHIKNYFYNKYFKDYAEKLVLEDQEYYQPGETLTSKRPLKATEYTRSIEALKHYESLCVDKA